MNAVFLLALFSITAAAQSLTQPPPLIRVIQVNGHGENMAPPVGNAAAGVFIFGMKAITGQAETWVVETHNSFADLETFEGGANGGERPKNFLTSDSRNIIAFYRQWWSHRPEEAIQALRKAHYMQVSIYRTGVGAEGEFAELLRARKASLDSINLDRPDLVYQVLAGAPSGTFLIFSPLPGLKVLDDGVSRSAAAYLRSTGTPSARSGANARTAAEISHENVIFAMLPRLSVVSAEFAETDPNFWGAARR